MKRPRVLLVLLVALVLLVGGALWSRRRAGGFASPALCVEAYRDACAAGDVPRYLACLGGPLRAEGERAATQERLKRELAGVVSWAQNEAAVSGATARVDVDRGRREGAQRVAFRLERRGGWLIVGIDAPRDLPTVVPYGTHVSKGP